MQKKCKKIIDGCQTPRYNEAMPNKRAENINRVTVTLDRDLLKAIEDFCKKNGMNRLEFIRKAMDEKLNAEKEKNKNQQ